MTREEAINIISQMIKDEEGFLSNNTVEAHKMAVKALKLEPCNDAISRQAVLNLINADWKYEGLEEDVSSLSPVTPQPKTGHWIRELIRNEKGGCIGAKMICSKCGNDNKHDEYMNYCPNCGAKMDESQESEVQDDRDRRKTL